MLDCGVGDVAVDAMCCWLMVAFILAILDVLLWEYDWPRVGKIG